jgi:hypothetical protein
MLALLARRNLLDRPWRTALLCLGYGFGVAVMVVLLSIGEAMLAQAGDEKLVGGGDVTVLPEGLDVEVLKTGGLGGLYFSIQNARFVQQQLLAAPRLAGDVRAVAPQIEGKLLYLRRGGDGREVPVRAAGEVPSATARWARRPALAAGRGPTTPATAAGPRPPRSSCGTTSTTSTCPRRDLARGELGRVALLQRALPRPAAVGVRDAHGRGRRGAPRHVGAGGAAVPRWGGQVLVTTHAQGEGGRAGAVRRFAARVAPAAVRFSTRDADLRVGGASVTRAPRRPLPRVAAAAAEDGLGGQATVDLVVTPAPRAYFPGATLASGDFASGYAVAGLRADADGRVCAPGWGRDAGCERYAGAQAYHDHNWGTWQGVTWEWGAGRAGAYTLLYGRVQPPDSLGARGRRRCSSTSSTRSASARSSAARHPLRRRAHVVVGGRPVRVPARGVMEDVRGADTLRVELEVEDAAATDTRLGSSSAARPSTRARLVRARTSCR